VAGRRRARATCPEAMNSESLFVYHLLAWEYDKGKRVKYGERRWACGWFMEDFVVVYIRLCLPLVSGERAFKRIFVV